MKTYTSSQQIVLSVVAALILFSGPSTLRSFCSSPFHDSQPGPYKQWIVEVLGSVPHPGLYLFKDAPTADEAIKKAGGKGNRCAGTRGCEPLRLASGTTIHVPSGPSQGLLLDPTDIHKSFIAGLPMDINTASVAELTLVPGISTNLAHRMVSYRGQHGYFTTWKDLDEVKGLGSATIERVKNHVRFPLPLPRHIP